MAIQHRSIPDSERHEAKGASTALSGQVLKSDGDATTSWVFPNTLSNINIASSLEGQSTANQGPSAVDTPYQVLFGAGGSNSDVSIASNGVITFTNAGLYFLTINLNFSRSNNVGIAKVVARILTNGISSGFTQMNQMDTSVNSTSLFATVLRSFSAADTVTIEILRDSTGANDGGLFTFDPALAGWNNVPSAAVRIQKIGGAS